MESSKHGSVLAASTRDRDVLNSWDAKQHLPADSKLVKTEETTKPKRRGIMKFFGNAGKSRKKGSKNAGKTTPLADEMMEICLDSTLVARDLLMCKPPSEMSSEAPAETVTSVGHGDTTFESRPTATTTAAESGKMNASSR